MAREEDLAALFGDLMNLESARRDPSIATAVDLTASLAALLIYATYQTKLENGVKTDLEEGTGLFELMVRERLAVLAKGEKL